MPADAGRAAGSKLCQGIKQRAYPVVEKSGILWAYLGEGEPPAFPELDCFVAPDSHVFAFKGHWACNWLQALEVGIDPSHASYLHRFFEDEDTSTTDTYGRQFRGATASSDMPMTKIMREHDRPIINIEHTEYGMRLITLREIDAERTHVRVTNQIFPHAFVLPMNQEMTITQYHVPIDDESCYWYSIFTSFTTPVDKKKMREQRLATCELPDYKSRFNKSNDYGFDPHEQATETYTGMGMDINVHDQWAVESTGAIQDRTKRASRPGRQGDRARSPHAARPDRDGGVGRQADDVPGRRACAQHPGTGAPWTASGRPRAGKCTGWTST